MYRTPNISRAQWAAKDVIGSARAIESGAVNQFEAGALAVINKVQRDQVFGFADETDDAFVAEVEAEVVAMLEEDLAARTVAAEEAQDADLKDADDKSDDNTPNGIAIYEEWSASQIATYGWLTALSATLSKLSEEGIPAHTDEITVTVRRVG